MESSPQIYEFMMCFDSCFLIVTACIAAMGKEEKVELDGADLAAVEKAVSSLTA